MSLFVVSSDDHEDRAWYAYGGIDTSHLQEWMREVKVADRRMSTLVRLWISGVISIGYPVVITSLLTATVLGLATQDTLEVNWHPIVILMFVAMGMACTLMIYSGSLIAKSVTSAIRGSKQKCIELGNPDTWESVPRASELRQRIGERLVSVLGGTSVDEDAFVRVRVVFDLFIIEQVDVDHAESIIKELIANSDQRQQRRTIEANAAEVAKVDYLARQTERREQIIDTY